MRDLALEARLAEHGADDPSASTTTLRGGALGDLHRGMPEQLADLALERYGRRLLGCSP